jgi:putative membrane protein
MNTIKTIGTRAALTAALALTFSTSVTLAQNSASQPQSTNSQPNSNMAPNAMSDADFAKEAAQGGAAEVKMGQLAQQKGTSDSVKNFGKRMVDDHTKAGDNLKAAATQSNIDLPTGMSAKDQATYDKLSKMSGTDFDRAYAHDMVRDHIHDVAAFHQESTSGKDDGIKSFATQTLPTLQDHLKDARAMASAVGSQARNNPTGARHNAAGSSSDPGSTAPPVSPQQ